MGSWPRSVSFATQQITMPVPLQVEKIRGGGEEFKHGWTLFSRMMKHPHQWYFRNVPFHRYFVITNVALIPLWFYLTNLTYNPANVKKWKEIRENRNHTYFECPKVAH